MTEILLRIWQVQGRGAEMIQEAQFYSGLRRYRPSVMKKELIKRNEGEDF